MSFREHLGYITGTGIKGGLSLYNCVKG